MLLGLLVAALHGGGVQPDTAVLCPFSRAQFAIYPLELVRTRLAVCPPGTYSGMIDCFARIIKQEGWRAFYRGLTPSLVRLYMRGEITGLSCAL